jgi:hypothetical protein
MGPKNKKSKSQVADDNSQANDATTSLAVRRNCYVLLDIDGVLLPIGKDDTNEPWDSFPECCMCALSKIIESTGAIIVLSSTWRATADARQHIIDEFKRYASKHGGPLGDIEYFEHMTSLENHSVRQWEVAEWVLNQTERVCTGGKSSKRKQLEPNANGFRWVALDDDTSLTEDARYLSLCQPHTVQTESKVGLTMADADKAIVILSQR